MKHIRHNGARVRRNRDSELLIEKDRIHLIGKDKIIVYSAKLLVASDYHYTYVLHEDGRVIGDIIVKTNTVIIEVVRVDDKWSRSIDKFEILRRGEIVTVKIFFTELK